MSIITNGMIDSATDVLAVQKLQAKVHLEQAVAYEGELRAVTTERQAAAAQRAESARHNAALEAIFTKQVATAEAMLQEFRLQGAVVNAPERDDLMLKVFMTLLPGVVKPSAATTSAGKLIDAAGDAEWLQIQVGQVMSAYAALSSPPAGQ